jgi:uncharacterized protein
LLRNVGYSRAGCANTDKPGPIPAFFMGGGMWQDLWVALALLMVIEGIWPFLNPAGMRRALTAISQQQDGALRTAGLVSMVCGVILLYLVNG